MSRTARAIHAAVLATAIAVAARTAAIDAPPDTAGLDNPARVAEAVTDAPPLARPQLLRELTGPNVQQALVVLGRRAKPGATDAVVPLTRSADGEVRAAAAWALGRCGAAAAVPALVAMTDDGYAGARAAAFWALGTIATPQAVSALPRGLSDPERRVRLATARGAEAGGSAACAALLAARLDYRIEERQPDEHPGKTIEQVVWVEPDPAVRLAVIQALAKLEVIDVLPAMIHAMEQETSFNRTHLIAAIEHFGSPAASVCLGRIVPTPYDKEGFETRMPLLVNNGTLAVIAGRLGDPRTVPYLLRNLQLPRDRLGQDKDLTELYIHTVRLLGSFGVEEAAPELAAILKAARVQQLADAARDAIRHIGRPAARPLARNADDWRLAPVFFPLLREPELRTAAVRDTLVEFLGHESGDVRWEATVTLGAYIHAGILDEYDLGLLESMYLDPDRRVRQASAKWRQLIREKFGNETVE